MIFYLVWYYQYIIIWNIYIFCSTFPFPVSANLLISEIEIEGDSKMYAFKISFNKDVRKLFHFTIRAFFFKTV